MIRCEEQRGVNLQRPNLNITPPSPARVASIHDREYFLDLAPQTLKLKESTKTCSGNRSLKKYNQPHRQRLTGFPAIPRRQLASSKRDFKAKPCAINTLPVTIYF